MKYDFNTPIDRRETDSLKWDVGDNELPMWVADMDFETAPAVKEAVMRRAAHGIYGYTLIPDKWYDAITGWWRERHGFMLDRDWLCFCTGVIPAISSAVKRVTNVGDRVVLLTPVYDIFYHSVENAGRTVLESRLSYRNGEYDIDFYDLEKKLSDPLCTMMILCNPHNPVGKIWTPDELADIGELCRRHGVTVLSDEIHCDLTDPGFGYTPFASVSEDCRDNSITCIAASKAFNLAGLQSAAVIIPDEFLRAKVVRGLNSDEVAEPNCFAAVAAAAAFGEGGEWLDSLRGYLAENKKAAFDFVAENLPEITPVMQNATYLLWLDCGKITDDAEKLADFIRKNTGLYISAGNKYRGNGNLFLRINVACPKETVMRGMKLLRDGIRAFEKEN